MKNEKIVVFHIGRGGHFNNPGYLSYIGLLGNGRAETSVSDLIDHLFTNEEETMYLDANGNEVVEVSEVDSNIFRIDNDGGYDTDYTKYLEDCNESEISAILNATGYVNADVLEFAKGNNN